MSKFQVGDRVSHSVRKDGSLATVVEVRPRGFYGIHFDTDEYGRVSNADEKFMSLVTEAAGVNPKDAIGMKKPPLHLVPTALNIYAAQAMRNGAAKYGPFNWRTKPIIASVYVSAALRHLNAWFDGEERAEDSNVEHLAHCVASLAILIDAIECGNVVDDRPAAGPAPKLIERFTES